MAGIGGGARRGGLAAALVVGGLAALAGCGRPAPEGEPPVPFAVAEGNALVEADPSPPPPANATLAAVGRVEDTGELDIFRVYRLDGDRLLSRTYLLPSRPYKDPLGAAWVWLSGTVAGPDRLEADRIGPVEGLAERLERAARESCALVEARRRSFDLNSYKRTERFRRAFADLEGMDLNAAPFRPASEVVAVDAEARRAAVLCGSAVMRQTPQRGDYLSFLAIYDLEGMRSERVLVRNTGFFLE